MSDDHDRCEWLNVSSGTGTGSPGLSWTVMVFGFELYIFGSLLLTAHFVD